MGALLAGLNAVYLGAGALALAAGPVPLLVAKGGRWHRLAGRAFAAGLLAAGLAALLGGVLGPNLIRLLAGWFALYLVLMGLRALRRPGGVPAWPDWVLVAVLAASGVGFAGIGLAGLFAGPVLGLLRGPFAAVLLALGVLALVLAGQDSAWLRRGPVRGRARLAQHLSRMLGGCIAAWTALCVTQLAGVLPLAAAWLGPATVFGVALVGWLSRVRAGELDGTGRG